MDAALRHHGRVMVTSGRPRLCYWMESRISGWLDGYPDECRARSRLYWPELIEGTRKKGKQ
uniref:Uncharacterized protein n=1 Tax=Peronospora matthiolae TaxID=2874970 RepID=A0AAV1U3H7_9STRA